ncbi:hypothetical protein GN958_ATG01854 [Phytophthora infestans]|uniref:Uncharacterized protein n=1 Tax=Phytophthora infestans TaxID=4787 RepID=A0A8S9VE84_PHYIN|nr:hypothetical protein GN958_ATG01854 [Phytophthora infestans]
MRMNRFLYTEEIRDAFMKQFALIILRVSCLHYPPNTQTVADAVRSLQALPLNHDALVIQFCEVGSIQRPSKGRLGMLVCAAN